MNKDIREMIDKIKNFKQFVNEERVPYNELQNMVKDFLNKEIQFTMDDIQKYVVGNIESVDYHTNGRGFEVSVGNYKSGDGIKDGSGSLSIFPDENKIIFSHNDFKPHPVSGLNEFTNNFFQFINKIDFKK